MTKRDWNDAGSRVLGMFLNGEEIATPDAQGRRVVDDSFLLLFNAGHEDRDFTLPSQRFGARWVVELRTDDPSANGREPLAPGHVLAVTSRSLVLLRRAT
jgi:glycogen operon protein